MISVTCASRQPHILFILADDYGWHDIGKEKHHVHHKSKYLNFFFNRVFPKVPCQICQIYQICWIDYKKVNHHNKTNYFFHFMTSFLFILIFILCSSTKIWIYWKIIFECLMLIFLHVANPINLTDLTSDFRETSIAQQFQNTFVWVAKSWKNCRLPWIWN